MHCAVRTLLDADATVCMWHIIMFETRWGFPQYFDAGESAEGNRMYGVKMLWGGNEDQDLEKMFPVEIWRYFSTSEIIQ